MSESTLLQSTGAERRAAAYMYSARPILTYYQLGKSVCRCAQDIFCSNSGIAATWQAGRWEQWHADENRVSGTCPVWYRSMTDEQSDAVRGSNNHYTSRSFSNSLNRSFSLALMLAPGSPGASLRVHISIGHTAQVKAREGSGDADMYHRQWAECKAKRTHARYD